MKKYGFLFLIAIVAGIWLAQHFYFKPKYVNGETAPNFEMKLIDGTAMEFEDLAGNFVLLDFWGSWCAPCRKDNPYLVKLHEEFNGRAFKDAKTFHIVSVALEMKPERWKAAIAKDGLKWPYHHADFKRMDSDIARLYGVREIPTKYLITPDGYIAGVNMSYEDLRKFLNERLAS